MSCRLLLSTLFLALFQATVSEDVVMDVAKLTKFTTSFTFKMDNVAKLAEANGPLFARMQKQDRGLDRAILTSNLIVNGKLIADIPGEMMKLKIDLSANPSQLSANPELPLPAQLKGTYLLTFDGPTGYVAIEGSGHAQGYVRTGMNAVSGMQFEVKGCMKYKFNPNMLLPPALVQKKIDQQAAMVRMQLNHMPHKVKDGLAYYDTHGPHPGIVVALRTSDGTPAAMWLESNGIPDVPATVEFSKFTAFEPFSEVQCVDTPSSSMLDDPRTLLALFVSEQLLTRLQLAAPISPVTQHVFAQLPRVLRDPDESSCVLPTEAASKATTPGEPFGVLGFVAAAMASAAVGAGMVVLGARRAFNMP